ncbi:MAG: carboxypeptidase-like regulatory domain-containing protein, partial [Acidobacteriota bacterium]
YRNTTPINFVPGGAADQYPSTITVSDGPGVNGAIRVTLYDVWHGIPDNIDILLVGPNGHKYVLMADAGGPVPIDPNTPVTLTFSDTALSVLPDSTALSIGTFKPTTWTTPIANFPGPAPVGPYVQPGSLLARPIQQSMFGQFGLVTTNGVWSLYVRDDNQPPAPAGDAPEGTSVGMIAGGWGIEFQAPTAAGVNVSGHVLTPDGRGLRNATVWMTDSRGVRRSVVSNSLGRFIFEDVPAGETYLLGVSSKRYRFTTRVLQIFDPVTDVDLVGLE